MCAALGVIYLPLARGNHKFISIEKYHRFLNKTNAIAGQYIETYDVFLQNVKIFHYAWNSAPIYGTNFLRSVAAVGQGSCFPLDVKLLQTPTTLNQGNSGIYDYL